MSGLVGFLCAGPDRSRDYNCVNNTDQLRRTVHGFMYNPCPVGKDNILIP